MKMVCIKRPHKQQMENDILFFKDLTRKQIKRNYNLVPADVYKNKDTIVIAPSGTKYRLKLFRSNSTTIKPEYQLIQKAAALGVGPNPIFIHDTRNFFVTIHRKTTGKISRRTQESAIRTTSTNILSMC